MLMALKLLETVGTVIPVPEDQQCGIFETACRHGSNTIRLYESYRVRVRFGTRRINHFVVVDGVGSEFVRACDQVKCEYRRRSYDLNV
ncbi:hypothetical protein T08_3144 [Trichinella sp. T8]|nr:hypothetical protein T08_3144 [Trichinella sp. T8]